MNNTEHIAAIRHAVDLFEGRITTGKFHELVSEPHDRTGVLLNLLQEAVDQSGNGHITFCASCGCVLLRRRLTGRNVYCPEKKCQAIAKLGRDKPVSLKNINADFTHSPIREMAQYNGGYPE